MRLASVLIVLSLGSSLLYGKSSLEKFVEAYDLEPLAESDYWRSNPGVLPYEECKFVTADGSRIHGYSGTAVVGFSKHKQPFTLFCFSKKLKVGYQIPLDVKKDRSFGGINLGSYQFTSGHMRHLDGKMVTDLLGAYKGFSGGLGAGVALAGAKLKNKQRISMSLNEIGSLTVARFGVGYRRLQVTSRALIESEIYSHYYLEKEAELRAAAATPPFGIQNIDEFTSMILNERYALNSWPDTKKYTDTFRFWIHHLKTETQMQDQCLRAQQNPRRQRQHMNCQFQNQDGAEIFDVRKLQGVLDPEFMETLRFQRVH